MLFLQELLIHIFIQLVLFGYSDLYYETLLKPKRLKLLKGEDNN
jgi:hypothetical protein